MIYVIVVIVALFCFLLGMSVGNRGSRLNTDEENTIPVDEEVLHVARKTGKGTESQSETIRAFPGDAIAETYRYLRTKRKAIEASSDSASALASCRFVVPKGEEPILRWIPVWDGFVPVYPTEAGTKGMCYGASIACFNYLFPEITQEVKNEKGGIVYI